jgi:hypothetical protein
LSLPPATWNYRWKKWPDWRARKLMRPDMLHGKSWAATDSNDA